MPMAKKRRKHQIEKEEKEYKPPEFDKKEFMETEINVAKGTILAALLAIPLGVVAFLVMPISVAGGLLVGLTGMGVVYFVLTILRVGAHSYRITHWLGVISSYFFLFLAVWILLCNPPFSDQAGPDIRNVQVSWGGTENYTTVIETEMGYVVDIPSSGLNLTIRARVTDNVQLVVDSVRISVDSNNRTLMTQNETIDYIFEYELRNAPDSATLTISARDVNGRENSFEFDLI
jgi:hypothetical protein